MGPGELPRCAEPCLVEVRTLHAGQEPRDCPASNGELTNTKINRGPTSRSHLPFRWAHE
jgi:hypothetical protein